MLLMYPGLPWQEDWWKAAATAADTVVVAPVEELSLPPVPGLPFAGRNPGDPRRYEVVKLHWRPSRVLGVAAHRITARRIRAVLAHAAEGPGPVDVIHAHTYYAADYLPRLARSLGVPYVVTEHDPAWYDHPSRPLPAPRSLARTRALFAEAASVLPVCEPLREALLAAGVEARYRVMANPVDTSALPRLPARARRGDDPVRVVAAGRLAPQKGYEVLLEAFALAWSEDRRLRLRIIGDGRLRDGLRDQAHRLALDGVVGLVGRLDRAGMLREMAHADLFALSSHTENHPLVAVEAMCVGAPVVATAVGALPEIVTPDCGRLVPPGDPRAFADALLDAAGALESFDRARIADRARRAHELTVAGAALAEVYEDAVKEHGRGR